MPSPSASESLAASTEAGGIAGTPLDDILARAGVGVFHYDRHGQILALNEAYCALFGRTAEDLASGPLETFLHPDDADRCAALHRRHLAAAAPLRLEARCLRPDGTVRWCDLDIGFVPGADGATVSTIVVALDITARRETERQLAESQDHHRNAVAFAPQISWTATPAGMIEEASARWAEATGSAPDSARGIGWLEALHPDDVSPTVATWTAALAAKTPVDVEYRLRTAQGGYRWFRASASASVDDQGEVLRWYGTLEDIDDRRRAEQSLRESEERFRLAAQAARLGIWDLDAVHDRREWSDEFKDMLGLPRDVAPEIATALALVVPEDRHLLEALIGAVRAGDSQHRFETTLRIRRADTGAERCMQTSGWRIEAPNGRLERVLVTIRDVTEERTVDQRIRWAATHDAFTALPNRAHFSEAFEAAIARVEAKGARLALILFDVDNLKAINDTIGHDAGDILLLTFARRLSAELGSDTFLARIGGDEFAAFVELAEGDDAVARITATLDTLRDPLVHESGTLNCQATAGISFFPGDGGSAADLLKAADIALYVGKNGRRGALSVFRPEMRGSLQRRASMLAVARTAARDDRILPYYQPKVRLSDGRVAGFEALLRWRHHALGIQLPETIAAAFEDYSLATQLGERMFDRICTDIRRWLNDGLAVGTVAFNLSAAEFRRDDLVDRILERLHRDGIPPAMLELEITETVFLGRGATTTAAMLAAFHREGMRIALDDFGTGYASLTHLQAFPVDVIKIDRSFVANVTAGGGDAAIVDTIIGLARRLAIDVVAEGIETRAQAEYLAARGCGLGQGYLFGRAMPAHDAEQLMRALARHPA